jgi:hypothetical protein
MNQIVKMQNSISRIKFLLVGIIVCFLFSCNENSDLRIKQLESENKKLKELINENTHKKIMNTQLLLLPENNNFGLNKKNRISLVFSEIQEYPNFELYYADEEFNYDEKNKIQVVLKDNNKIEFDFTPKSKTNNTINLIATIMSGSGKVKLYGKLELPVE